jgi:NADH dehydrogenase
MNSVHTVLVVGGTGLLGAPVVRRLREAGHRVRLLVRDPARARARLGASIEYAPGDVEDAGAVERALAGCDAVHVSLRAGHAPGEPERVEHQGTARIAAAARRLGLARLTYVSGSFVDEVLVRDSPGDRAKLQAEEAIRRSGVPFTIFRPTYFMDTLPRHVQGRFAVVIGRQPHPLHMVAADDFAGMVVRALRTPEATNRAFFVQGPEAITLAGALRLYCRVVEPGKLVVTVPLSLMALVDTWFAGGKLGHTLAVMRLLQRVGERGDASETHRVLGPPATTLRTWCEQQRARRVGEAADSGRRERVSA